ncbi:MAG: hypothetical protein AAGE96_21575 [Cyanobacteria bacterium P01_G01_bin.19]
MRDTLDSSFKRGNPANGLSRKTVAGVPPVVPKGYRKHKVIVEGGD